MKILIDNGHGENTPGKRSPDGLFREYKWAREIAKGIVCKLHDKGYDAERIVKEENDISLSERVKRVNDFCDKLGSNNVILISIHNNAAGNGSKWMKGEGWEIWTSVGETESDKLAKYICDAVKEEIPDTKIRQENPNELDKEKNYTILAKTKCPAVLTENFFQDNKKEVEFLLSDEGKEKCINIHVKGIINYLLNK